MSDNSFIDSLRAITGEVSIFGASTDAGESAIAIVVGDVAAIVSPSDALELSAVLAVYHGLTTGGPPPTWAIEGGFPLVQTLLDTWKERLEGGAGVLYDGPPHRRRRLRPLRCSLLPGGLVGRRIP